MFWGYFCGPETNYLEQLTLFFCFVCGLITIRREVQIYRLINTQK